ncbi:integrase [Pseudovibrio japonicus]|uniref:Integrase n=1 Tax=Pseudovibrio japonicus TaxID=366534 RepID=A0ABQ3EFV3_9HYPH|nr:site-specific integrase [Pseudovibrio japonicus]GHB33244.1 integrase [Pseudovibrio japonicus]
MARISKQVVDQAQPQSKDAYVWDEELKGFGLKITPTGHKVYLIQYRIGGRAGRTRRYTIGRHGKITPDAARKEAKRLLGEALSGNDPSTRKDEKRGAKSLYELIETFLEEHAEAKLKPVTALEYRRSFDLHVKTRLYNVPVEEITRADVTRMHHAMRAKPYQANRTLAFLSKFFNWCEKYGYRPDGSNPCRHVEKFKEYRRERFLSAEELGALSEAIRVAETEGFVSKKGNLWKPSVFAVAAVRLLIMTGARLSEILTLKWEYIDFKKAQAHLPDSKTGAKTLYLNAPALALLNDLPELEGNPYVICGDKPGTHIVNLQKAWRKIRAEAGLEDVRIHDLRHSFASVAAGSGMSLPMIGKLLGHSQPATTARYAHLASDPMQQASEAIAKAINGAMNDREISNAQKKS